MKLIDFLRKKFTKKTDAQLEISKLKKAKDKKKSKSVKSEFKKEKKKSPMLVYNLNREKKKRKKFDIHKSLDEFLEKSGMQISSRQLNRRALIFSAALTSILIIAIIAAAVSLGSFLSTIITMVFLTATLVFVALYLISLVVLFFYIDLKIYNRTKQLEKVLPDFLQLTSANISAGMPIDRALWLAVRPRFGVLANEIEEIAKATIAGEDLNEALLKFSRKYNSRILKESINLLIAGIDSGGEIASLLNKISINISETRLMQKEISANVMTYVIFISVATIAAAPFLFALSGQLLATTKTITSNVQLDQSASTSSFLSFNLSGDSIKLSDFTNFSILVMVVSSFFSVAITSVIRKGNVKDGIKLFPIYMAISLLIFFVSKTFFSYMFSGFF